MDILHLAAPCRNVPVTFTLDRMKRRRLFLGPIANPTWWDFLRRVGGALTLVAAVILVARELAPGYVGIAVLVVCTGLVALAAVQEWRQVKARRERRK